VAKPPSIKSRIARLPAPTRVKDGVTNLLFGEREAPNRVYDPGAHPAQLLAYFRAAFEALEGESRPRQVVDDHGRVTNTRALVDPPTLVGFAARLGVRRETLWRWAEQHTEFGEAMDVARAMQQHVFIALASTGAYDSRFASFCLKNLHEWTDRVEQTSKGAVTLVFDAQDAEA